MDNDSFIKIAALGVSAIGSLFATWKIVTELLRGKHSRLREEYKFAKDFLSEANPTDRHPFLSQLGYQAIAGDAGIGAEEISYIFSLSNPRGTLQDYLFARTCLAFYSTSHPTCISYRHGLERARKRLALKVFYFLAYSATYLLAVSPLFLTLFKLLSPSLAAVLFVLSGVLFFPLAFLSLKAGARISRAEKLIAWQAQSAKNSSLHTGRLSRSLKPTSVGKPSSAAQLQH